AVGVGGGQLERVGAAAHDHAEGVGHRVVDGGDVHDKVDDRGPRGLAVVRGAGIGHRQRGVDRAAGLVGRGEGQGDALRVGARERAEDKVPLGDDVRVVPVDLDLELVKTCPGADAGDCERVVWTAVGVLGDGLV